ncbi:MAG: lipid-binding SYLF domain-containing protein [Pseudomonadales bacterium]|nr:lipid-binding SYLF domain-containing protein [Pseudomonadales bacterium]
MLIPINLERINHQRIARYPIDQKNITYALFFCLLLVSAGCWADKYQDTTRQFKNASKSAAILQQAYGYAVFPNIGKGGIGIGAAYGKGKVYVAKRFTGDVTMSQLSVGFQLGGQAYSQLILFEDKRAFMEFTSGSFEFGAHANAVALTLSASVEASTKGAGASTTNSDESQAVAKYYKGMAVYTLSKGGLMYEAALSGQKFSYRAIENVPTTVDLSTSI